MTTTPTVEGHPIPVTAVVLAAGRSSRMGRAKQLATVAGEAMVVRATRIALASKAERVLVVTGAYADQIKTVLIPLQEENAGRLEFVHNPAWSTGQASSVQTAVHALANTCQAVLFLPTDQPFVPVTLLDNLIIAWQAGALLAAPAVAGQPRGAPAIFDGSIWSDLLDLSGDTGARPLLQRYRNQLITIPAEAAWLHDIDTPEDLDQLSTGSKQP
ncbi:MAG: nucleotidyltransferase family protein [Caldilineaceae bacterium]